MIYKFNNKTLKYDNVTRKAILVICGILLTTSLVTVMFIVTRVNDVRFITQETKQIIIKQEQEFTPEKLKAYILELNIRFPHIVYAQALLESGEFKSHIFKENNNFFGMKQAKQRPTTNKGTENGHAYFVNWRDCVVDYAFYQAAYLNDLRSESEYFAYLGQNYAEDPGYVGKLKKIIEKTTE
jgi:flagellum-specific peptidoglycan hydrolase FlgJ